MLVTAPLVSRGYIQRGIEAAEDSLKSSKDLNLKIKWLKTITYVKLTCNKETNRLSSF